MKDDDPAGMRDRPLRWVWRHDRAPLPPKRFETEILSYTAAVCLMLAWTPVALGGPSGAASRERFNRVVLEIRAHRTSYLPGEPVRLEFRAINRADAPVLLPGGSDVWHGHLKVLIAYEAEGYREYRGPRWGLRDVLDAGSIKLRPGGVFKTEATVLYSHPFRTVSKELARQYVATEYALGRAGTYQIKAILSDEEFEDEIESQPIEIVVEEPHGMDRDVWNELKTNPEYGYFIQTGGKGHPRSVRTAEVVAGLDRIVTSYPTSRYVKTIAPSLRKYRLLREELRKQEVAEP
jgi:hypothetical protein